VRRLHSARCPATASLHPMETSSARSIPGPRCCCGSTDCAYLAHNGRLLEGLEHNVSRAAQLGQVRLSSHCCQ
jgi:hypothetical protein